MVYYDYTNAIFMALVLMAVVSAIKASLWKAKYKNLKGRCRKL